MNHLLSLNWKFCLFPHTSQSMHRHCLDFQAVLRVGFTDLLLNLSFFFSSFFLMTQEDRRLFYPLKKYIYFAVSSFLKLIQLICIFCFNCHIKYMEPNGPFKEDFFSFPNLNSFEGVLNPFVSEFDLPPLKIVYSTCCLLSWTWMLISTLLVSVSSARLSSSSTLGAAPGA